MFNGFYVSGSVLADLNRGWWRINKCHPLLLCYCVCGVRPLSGENYGWSDWLWEFGGKGGSYNNGSYNSGKGGSSSAPTSTSTPTQTADLSVGAIVVGAVAAVSLAGAAFTVTRRKKK